MTPEPAHPEALAHPELAGFIQTCIARNRAFALWREPHAQDIHALGAPEVQALNRLLPGSLDQDGFLLAPFRLSETGGSDGHPALYVPSDGPVLAYRQADVSAAAAGGITLGDMGAYATAPSPRILVEKDYHTLVESGVTAIRDGVLEKIVASRAEPRPLGEDYDVLAYYLRLCEKYRHAMVALVGVPGRGLWIVATPETLLAVDGATIRTMALAGTQPLPDDADPADVLWSAKFIEEQALVSRYIRAILEETGLTRFHETGPATVRAANLAHLCSWFEIDAGAGSVAEKVDDLVRLMHPTSAVCGMPRDAAFAFLAEHEAYDRSYYSGFLGPTRGADGEKPQRAAFFVNLRSAQFIGADIVLYVGAGVTGFSDPAEEWEETVQKTKTLGALL